MPRNEKEEILLLATEAREVDGAQTVNFRVPQGVGGILVIDVTARAGATTLTPKLTMLSEDEDYTWTFDLWTAKAAIDSADTTVAYAFYPGAEDTDADYTEEVNMALPVKCKLTVTHSDTASITYSAHLVAVS